MERIRIIPDGTPAQQELPLVSPPSMRRVRLSNEDAEAVTLRVTNKPVPNNIREAFHADASRTITALATNSRGQMMLDRNAFLFDMTGWSRARPPCSGYWELKQRSALAPDAHNWWYSAVLNAWHRGVPQQNSADARFVTHGVLMQGYEWRGMRKPWPDGYAYELERAEFASGIAINVDNIAPYSLHDAAGLVRSEMTPPVVEDRNPARRRVML